MTRVVAAIHEATPADLAHVVRLIRVGDGRDYEDANVERFIQRLDPAHCRAWLAVADDRPVGMSMFYRRSLRADPARYTAGYWANLYIDPHHRDQMLYPRLPLAMFDAVRQGTLDFIYALVRRQNLIQAHQRIGAATIGDLSVLIKPLRPVAFLAKYKHWPALCRAVARPADAVYAGYLRLRRPRIPPDMTIETASWESDAVADLADLLNEHRGDRIGHDWTVDALRARYAVSLDGDPYILLIVRRRGRPEAAVVFRLTDRDHGLRVAVIMDLAWRPAPNTDAANTDATNTDATNTDAANTDPHNAAAPDPATPNTAARDAAAQNTAARVALAEVHRLAYHDGAEAVMYLDGLGEPSRPIVSSLGYVRSPETFTLVLWPKKRSVEHPTLADTTRWRLAFGDHDAF